ncbi:tyrosine-type recombinase/integrase [Vibrio breoganii]
MASNKLTATKISKAINDAKSSKKTVRHSDGDKLYVCVEANGRVHWELRYIKPADGKTTYMRFGTYPSLGLSKAREGKDTYLGYLQKGIDPQIVKNGSALESGVSAEITFYQCSEILIERNPLSWKARTIRQKRGTIKNHLQKDMGPVPIKHITTSFLFDVLDKILSKNTVKKAIEFIGQVIDYADILCLDVSHISTRKLKKYFKQPAPTHYPAIEPIELKELIKKLIESNTTPIIFCLFMWQLHLLLRPSEAAITEWGFIDLDNRKVTYPKMKTDKEHSVPLSPSVIELLLFLQKFKSCETYVFKGRTKAGHAGIGSIGSVLRRLGYQGEMTAHGTRCIGSTMLHNERIPTELVEATLSHVDKNPIRAAYYRENFFKPRIPVMEMWSEFVDEALHWAIQELDGSSLPLLDVAKAIQNKTPCSNY